MVVGIGVCVEGSDGIAAQIVIPWRDVIKVSLSAERPGQIVPNESWRDEEEENNKTYRSSLFCTPCRADSGSSAVWREITCKNIARHVGTAQARQHIRLNDQCPLVYNNNKIRSISGGHHGTELI